MEQTLLSEIQERINQNAPNFIGTVIKSGYAGRNSKEDPYPIPPEYQAKVNSKKNNLANSKLMKLFLKRIRNHLLYA